MYARARIGNTYINLHMREGGHRSLTAGARVNRARRGLVAADTCGSQSFRVLSTLKLGDRLIRLCRFIVMKVRPQRFEPTGVLRQLSSLVVARATEEIISAQLSERLQRAHMFLQQLNIISYIRCCGSHMDATRCFYMWLWRKHNVSVE